MIITIIILSVLVLILFWRLHKVSSSGIKYDRIRDVSKMLENRKFMMKSALSDYKMGKINRETLELLTFLFHPDFKNLWDYVPPERQQFTLQMQKLDSAFWKQYRISPDFAIPANVVYELYKSYMIKFQKDNQFVS